MKKWYIGLLTLLIVLAGCGTEDDGTMNEGADTDPQGEVTTEDDQDEGSSEDEDTVTNDGEGQETENQNGDGENGASSGETAYDRGVKEFELSLEFLNDDKWEYEYRVVNGSIDAEIEIDNGRDIEGTDEAVEEIENLLQNVVIDEARNQDEMIDDILGLLDVSRDELEEFELEIDYEDGTKIEFEQNF